MHAYVIVYVIVIHVIKGLGKIPIIRDEKTNGVYACYSDGDGACFGVHAHSYHHKCICPLPVQYLPTLYPQ